MTKPRNSDSAHSMYLVKSLDKHHKYTDIQQFFYSLRTKIQTEQTNKHKSSFNNIEPHTIGEVLITPVLKEVISTVMHERFQFELRGRYVN